MDLRMDLIHSPIGELHEHVEANSLDIILTDPPYPKEFLHTWGDLATFSVHALKEDGHLLAMSGHAWLPQVFELLTLDELNYQWTLEFRMRGLSSGCIGRRIARSFWKPILWYTKGINRVYPMTDMIWGAGRDKNFHEWGQSEESFHELLNRFVPPGSVVCDPFLGGGTTAVAAVDHGSHFVGADIEAECIAITKDRLAAYQTKFI